MESVELSKRPLKPDPADFPNRDTKEGKRQYDDAFIEYNQALARFFKVDSLSDIMDIMGRLPDDPEYEGPF